jgi:SagB-type dehydrogenase family enzyme
MEDTIQFKLNPLFKVDLVTSEYENMDGTIINLLLEGKTYEVSQDFLFSLILYFNKNVKSKGEIINFLKSKLKDEGEKSIELFENLVDKSIIVELDYRTKDLKAVEHWVERGWLDALTLHLTSRNIDFSDDAQSDIKEYLDEQSKQIIQREGMTEIYKKTEGEKRIKLRENIPLPKDRSFEEILVARRTHRPWSKNKFLLDELSNILLYSSVETKRLREETKDKLAINPSTIYNSSFSALEIYLFVYDVEDLEPGLYFYDVKDHSLYLLKAGLFREQVAKMCIGQERAGTGRVTFLISANWQRYMFRYRHPRAYRNLLINTSELAQKLLILSTSYRKTTFLTPALNDELADDLLNLNGYEEAPLYVVTAG